MDSSSPKMYLHNNNDSLNSDLNETEVSSDDGHLDVINDEPDIEMIRTKCNSVSENMKVSSNKLNKFSIDNILGLNKEETNRIYDSVKIEDNYEQKPLEQVIGATDLMHQYQRGRQVTGKKSLIHLNYLTEIKTEHNRSLQFHHLLEQHEHHHQHRSNLFCRNWMELNANFGMQGMLIKVISHIKLM